MGTKSRRRSSLLRALSLALRVFRRLVMEREVEGYCCSMQLIDGEGNFRKSELKNFIKAMRLRELGKFYAVVSIVGPQSSGKSTLMNHLFGTNFREMDAADGRVQTTKGIWIARCVDMKPFTLALDVEGNDGSEREDNTAFEKQSALFALFISNAVLINIWCHDIGREQGAGKGLMKSVFLVMLRLLKPHKKTLLFVIRDKSKTPMDVLIRQITVMMEKIWNSISKPKDHKDAKFSDFFNVEAFGLASYEQNEDLFKTQVGELKRLLSQKLSAQLAERGQEFVGSELALGTERAWKLIRQEKSLHLSNIKEVVSTLVCKEAADDALNGLAQDKEWLDLEKALRRGPPPGSGERLAGILETYLSQFDEETLHFDATIRARRRQELENDAWQLVQTAYGTMLEHIYVKFFQIFQSGLKLSVDSGKGFAESARQCKESCLLSYNGECADRIILQAQSDASKMRERLCDSINTHVAHLQCLKLDELLLDHKRHFTKSIAQRSSFFDAVGKDTWAEIRNIYKLAKMESVQNLSIKLSSFELPQERRVKMVRDLENFTREEMIKRVKEESENATTHMIKRFSRVFRYDQNSKLREWTSLTNIKKITKKALYEALECLSDLAVIRLDEMEDNIKNLLSCLMDDRLAAHSLDLQTWEGVSPKDTLIKPVDCKPLWAEFLEETKVVIDQAKLERAANMAAHIKIIIEVATAALGVITTILSMAFP